MTYRLKSLDVAPEGCGYFYLQILLSWIVLVNPYNTFEYQSTSKYFDCTLVKYSPIQVSSLYLCQQGQKMVWTISECSKILAMKIPGAENPRAEMSPLPKHAPFGAADVWADGHFNMGTFRHGAFSARRTFSTGTFWLQNISAQSYFGIWDLPWHSHTCTFQHADFSALDFFGRGTFWHGDFSAPELFGTVNI